MTFSYNGHTQRRNISLEKKEDNRKIETTERRRLSRRELKHKEEACRGNVRYSFAFKAFTFQEKGGGFLLDEKVNTNLMSLLRRPADTKPGRIICL